MKYLLNSKTILGGVQYESTVPCVADRVAQTVIKLTFEPIVEKVFLPDSYGYRPNKSAHDAVGITRQRCWKYDWVLEFDIIKGLFDNIPHELLLKLHTQCKWTLLYIERWLKAPMAWYIVNSTMKQTQYSARLDKRGTKSNAQAS